MTPITFGPGLRSGISIPALLLFMCPLAAAQDFNVDCNNSAAAPIPSDLYGAAAGQVGHWTGIASSGQLEDLNGNPTGVFLQVPAQAPIAFDEACTAGDDEALLDDIHDPVDGTYRISGLIPGDYTIFTYAMAPDDPTFLTDVSVQGSPDGIQTVGGDFCAGHALGTTYARHTVTTANGLIFIDITVNASFSSVNGFQIVCDSCSVGTPICFGIGGTACPCGNDGGAGEGCANGSGSGAAMSATGTASVANDSIVLNISNAVPSQPGLFFQGDNSTNGGNGVTFGDGLRCCGANVVRLQISVPDGSGSASTSVPIAATGGANPGETKCYQFWYRDPAGSPCGNSFNLSSAYEITWQ